MGFDGSYPRAAREAGELHRIFVRRARCGSCGSGEALLPDFLLRRRRGTTASVGAAVLPRLGAKVPQGAEGLYAGVPGRTVRSFRQRFAGRADDLALRSDALGVGWGGSTALGSQEPSAPAPRRPGDGEALAGGTAPLPGRGPTGLAARQRRGRQPAHRHPRRPAVAGRPSHARALPGALTRTATPPSAARRLPVEPAVAAPPNGGSRQHRPTDLAARPGPAAPTRTGAPRRH